MNVRLSEVDIEAGSIKDEVGCRMSPAERHVLRRELAAALFQPPPPPPAPWEPVCRECGCWDWNACVDACGPCGWVEEDLCSVCAARMQALANRACAGLYEEDGP